MLTLYDLTTEYKTKPIGLDEQKPRFSWKLKSDQNDTRQIAYRLTVCNGELLWDTGRIDSDQSILIEYMGKAFDPCTTYAWNVTVWDNHGESAKASSEFEKERPMMTM